MNEKKPNKRRLHRGSEYPVGGNVLQTGTQYPGNGSLDVLQDVSEFLQHHPPCQQNLGELCKHDLLQRVVEKQEEIQQTDLRKRNLETEAEKIHFTQDGENRLEMLKVALYYLQRASQLFWSSYGSQSVRGAVFHPGYLVWMAYLILRWYELLPSHSALAFDTDTELSLRADYVEAEMVYQMIMGTQRMEPNTLQLTFVEMFLRWKIWGIFNSNYLLSEEEYVQENDLWEERAGENLLEWIHTKKRMEEEEQVSSSVSSTMVFGPSWVYTYSYPEEMDASRWGYRKRKPRPRSPLLQQRLLPFPSEWFTELPFQRERELLANKIRQEDTGYSSAVLEMHSHLPVNRIEDILSGDALDPETWRHRESPMFVSFYPADLSPETVSQTIQGVQWNCLAALFKLKTRKYPSNLL